jgi:hypothetical protein
VHRRAPEVDGDLEDIVVGIAERCGSFEAAERMVSGIAQRFNLLGTRISAGRATTIWGPAGAASLWANT